MNLLADFLHEYRRHKRLADEALAQLDDATFVRRPADHVNPVALIVKHVAGNLISRWTDFLTSDGEKPGRNRDEEFIDTFGSRAEMLEYWERGWAVWFGTLRRLKAEDLRNPVSIRGEAHSVPLAWERS